MAFLVLACGYYLIPKAFAINLTRFYHPFEDKRLSYYSITNYNVGLFSLDRFKVRDDVALDDTLFCRKLKSQLANIETDILCVQEFYNNDLISAESTLLPLVKKGFVYYYMNPILYSGYPGFFGVLTLSKFPILKAGKISYPSYEENFGMNTGVWTDILLGKDTIRVFNIHLHSMSIRVNKVKGFDQAVSQTKLVAKRLKNGFTYRTEQIGQVDSLMNASPYPVVLVGDFNEIPFSYPMMHLSRKYTNAFEEKGFGFGFSYRDFPWFIRIDHQLYDKKIEVVDAQYLHSIKGSDHYPLLGKFKID